MKPLPSVRHWLCLALGLGLLAAVFAVRQRRDLLPPGDDEELVQLRSERQRLAAFEPAAMHALHASLAALERDAALPPSWPDGWAAQAGDAAGQVRWRLAPREIPSWSGLVRAVTALAAVPGNRIVSFEIRSRGSLTERTIAAVEIVLVQPTAPPSRRNPSGGTAGPGAEVPAKPPAVGAGPSLRRPSTSAEPAAAGRTFAPIRPDPRGPRAGVIFPQPPQPKKP